jgi:hypothetical protein
LSFFFKNAIAKILPHPSANILIFFDLEEKRNVYANQKTTNLLGYTLPEIQSSGETLIPRISHPEDTINNDRKIAINNIIKC